MPASGVFEVLTPNTPINKLCNYTQVIHSAVVQSAKDLFRHRNQTPEEYFLLEATKEKFTKVDAI
jgi:hypothetical protein